MTDKGAMRPSSQRKHRAILEAAEEVFVRDGYDSSVLDEIAERSGVSKQTLYAHFSSKQELFVQVVISATAAASDALEVAGDADPIDPAQLPGYLERYGVRQLDVVLRPRLLGLRRLVIAETRRFPQLGAAFLAGGPGRTMTTMGELFARLHDTGLLSAPDPAVAARTFNWLLMASPLNTAMLLGDEAVPPAAERRAIAEEATRVFLAAHGFPSH